MDSFQQTKMYFRLVQFYHLTSLQPQKIIQHPDKTFTDQSTVFKLKVSFGFILRNNKTGQLQFYYASQNNDQLIAYRFQIATRADLQSVQALRNLDVLEWVRQRGPNSKWVFRAGESCYILHNKA